MASSGVAFERSSQAAGFRAAPAVFRISRRRCCHPECGNRNSDKTYFKKSVAPLRGSLDIPTFHIATTHTEKLSCPVLRLIKLERLFLTRAGLRLEIVDPADKRRQAHENRLGTAARFQSENRPSIVEQVEFYVTAAAVELILSFVIAIGLTQTALRDGQVRLEERIADISNEGKVLLSELLGKVSVYRGKIHTGFLENLSFLENACAPSTASRALPCVFAKAASIEFLDSPGDSILQLSEIRFGVFTPTRAFHHTGRIIYNYSVAFWKRDLATD